MTNIIFGGGRADVLLLLNRLASYYETHEDAPLPDEMVLPYYVPTDTDEKMSAEVDRIAALLGTTPQWRNGYYIACRECGGSVRYEAIAVPAAVRAKVVAASVTADLASPPATA